MNVYAVILCGGKGERFWPKSRARLPKQFMVLFGKYSLVRATSERIRRLCPPARQFFVTGAHFAPLLKKEFPGKRLNLLLEPVGKNTAPAIGFAAAVLSGIAPDGVMVVLPADHLITPTDRFLEAVELALHLARDGYLVTFGVVPTRPDTGYGYIHFGEELGRTGGLSAHRVLEFKEKPDQVTAQSYLASGEYLWNSGMFVWRVDAILEGFERFMPEFFKELEIFRKSFPRARQKAVRRLYQKAPEISIDYAIMERAENVAVVRADFVWDDVGSWLALERQFPKDENGNVKVGLSFALGANDCIVYSDEGVVALLGTKDLVVVRSGDAVLVAERSALDRLKELLRTLGRDPKGRRFL